MHLQMYIYMPSVGSCDNGVNGVSFALSVRLSCSALSDGWLLVIVCRDQYTVWASGSPSELMAAGSAAIEPWDRYIRPERRCWERNTLPAFVLQGVPCVCNHMSAELWLSVRTDITVSAYQRIAVQDSLLTQTNQKPRLLQCPLSLVSVFQAGDGKSLPPCFSAFSPSIPPVLSIQSAAVAVRGIN